MPSRSFDPIASMVFSLDSDSFSKGHSVYIHMSTILGSRPLDVLYLAKYY